MIIVVIVTYGIKDIIKKLATEEGYDLILEKRLEVYQIVLYVKPEFEIFDTGDLHYVHNLIKQGLVEKPYWIQLVMSPRHTFPEPSYLLTMLQRTPPGSLVSVIGVGIPQLAMITMAMILGCHVRVGMEDNIYISKGKLAASNAEFVEKVVRLAKELGRDIATPQQARRMIGLSEKPRQYHR